MTDPIVARWAEAERILDDLLELTPQEQRARARERCGDDAELASVVLRLLDASATDVPAAAAAFVRDALTSEAVATSGPPAFIGPFRVLAELGRGGMGRVLLAVRDGLEGAPRVAIKVLDRQVEAAEARRRFDRERETLARLDHPHIARLFDGGVTELGVPYLVMEYVEGLPIDRHCVEGGLALDARLALMRQVCEAVEFAHSRLVVHRDLKPANVMVDAHGQVKLLDFGIAKWIDELDAESPLTLTSHRVLTPAHAAPEQFRGEAITAATDVYQLGLLLYTLLTGQRAHAVGDPTPEAVRRAVCDTEPTRPSAAVNAQTGTAAERSLARRLAGDLDAIVMKSLQKDPRDRYATVEALRRDLDNYQQNLPVSARQGTGLYAVRKYARRHPAPVAAAAGVLVASVVGLVAVLSQARVTAAERDRAVAAEGAAAAVNSFLVNELLTAPTPERAQGRALTVAEVLDNASKSVGYSLKDSPGVQTDVRTALARSYLALGRPVEAKVHAVEAHRLAAATRSADDPAVLATRRLLVDVALAAGEVQQLRAEAEDVLAGFTRALGASHSETLLAQATAGRVLDALDQLAAAETSLHDADALASANQAVSIEARTAVRAAYIDTLIARGKARVAEPLARQQLDWLTAHFGPAHPQLVPAGRQLARALTEMLEYERAVEATVAQVRLHEQLYGPDHPATARVVNDLSVAYDRAARDGEALAAARRALDIRTRALGLEHPDTMMSMRNVAISLRRSGRPAEALPLYRTVAENYARALGDLHPRAIAAADDVGNALLDLGRVNETRTLRRAVAARYDRAVATVDVDPAILDDYAVFLMDAEPEDLRQPARAVALAARAVEATQHGDFGMLRTLALAYEAAGDRTRAMATAREASAMPAGIQSFATESLVVRLMRDLEPDQLEGWLIERLARLQRERGPDEYLQVRTLEHLARFYVTRGRPAEAEARIREQLDVLRRSVPPTHFMVASAEGALGERLLERGALAEAELLLRRAFDGMMASRRFTAASRAQARDRLVRVYEALQRPAEAERYRDYVLPAFTDR